MPDPTRYVCILRADCALKSLDYAQAYMNRAARRDGHKMCRVYVEPFEGEYTRLIGETWPTDEEPEAPVTTDVLRDDRTFRLPLPEPVYAFDHHTIPATVAGVVVTNSMLPDVRDFVLEELKHKLVKATGVPWTRLSRHVKVEEEGDLITDSTRFTMRVEPFSVVAPRPYLYLNELGSSARRPNGSRSQHRQPGSPAAEVVVPASGTRSIGLGLADTGCPWA